MKILLVGRYGEHDILSGPEKVAKNLFHNIYNSNPDSNFLTYFFKSSKRRNTKELLFGSETISTTPGIRRVGVLNLAAKIIKSRPDIVHLVTFERFELVIVFLRIFLNFKLIYTIHGIYKYERKIFYKKPSIRSDIKDLLLEKIIFIKSDILVFLSSQMSNLAQQYYKIGKSKVVIIPNGVSIPKLSTQIKNDLSDRLEIVFFNGLDDSRNRGVEKLIKILSMEKMKALHLSIIGMPFKTEFNSITFHSPMSDDLLFNLLIKKHIFIDNLDYMPFSIIALEAMALGLILIVSDKSGVSAYINNGKNGFVYNSEKPEEIGVILNDILLSKHDLGMISKNAKMIILTLNWPKIAEKYLNAYNSVI